MLLEEAYFISGIIAAIGMVGSVLYLATQIQQNTKSVRMSTGQAITQDLRTLFRYSAESDSADVVYRGFQDIANLEGSEKMRFYAMMHDYFFAFQNAYFQMDAGTLDGKYWSTAVNALKHISTFPGVRTFWHERNFCYADEFQTFVDKTIMKQDADPYYHLAGTRFERPAPKALAEGPGKPS